MNNRCEKEHIFEENISFKPFKLNGKVVFLFTTTQDSKPFKLHGKVVFLFTTTQDNLKLSYEIKLANIMETELLLIKLNWVDLPYT